MSSEVVNSELEFGGFSDAETVAGFAEDDGRYIASFRDLDVWKEGMALSKDIYQFTAAFPREELYGLTSQLRRAGVSIPANIAEGYGRETTRSFIQFLRIAQGSAKEVETLAELSSQLKFLPAADYAVLNAKVITISKMLRGLIRSLEKRRQS